MRRLGREGPGLVYAVIIWVHVYLWTCTAGGMILGWREPWTARTWGYWAGRRTAVAYPGSSDSAGLWVKGRSVTLAAIARHGFFYGLGASFARGLVPPWGLVTGGALSINKAAFWAVVASEARFFSTTTTALTWLVWILETEGSVLGFAAGTSILIVALVGVKRRNARQIGAGVITAALLVVLGTLILIAAACVEISVLGLQPAGWAP